MVGTVNCRSNHFLASGGQPLAVAAVVPLLSFISNILGIKQNQYMQLSLPSKSTNAYNTKANIKKDGGHTRQATNKDHFFQ